ncbi:MAG: O-antigen ligase family protein [Anaerolineae bacterium]
MTHFPIPITRSKTPVVEPEILSTFGKQILTVLCFSLAIPLFDIPVFGVSLSAPLIGLLMLEVIFRARFPFFYQYRRAILWALLMFLALVVVQSALTVTYAAGLISVYFQVVRYGFWILAFVVMLYVSHDIRLFDHTLRRFGLFTIGLGLLRLGEAVFFGRTGNATAELFTQNGYGIQFSIFLLYAFYAAMQQTGRTRILYFIGLSLTLFAILINGSRSSWIGLAAGGFIIGLIYVIVRPSLAARFITVIVIFIVGLVVLFQLFPERMAQTFQDRLESFNEIDSDKSFIIRELMIQKALLMFQADPLFGAGLGQFKLTYAPLVLPDELRYQTVEYFNRKSAHNSYMQLLGETGLTGTVPFLAMVVVAIIFGLRAAIKLLRAGYQFAPFVYGAFIAMSIHLWSLAGLTGTATWVAYGLVIGLVYMASRLPASAEDREASALQLQLNTLSVPMNPKRVR